MNQEDHSLATTLLGEGAPAEELLPHVYTELRNLAWSLLRREKPGQTLTATALVHEAYVRLSGGRDIPWDNRGHFFSAAAEAMRRILVERARRYARLKHGGGKKRLPLDELRLSDDAASAEYVLALDEALKELDSRDKRMSDVVKLRFFAGLSNDDIAKALGVTRRTVIRDWVAARAWLLRMISAEDTSTPGDSHS
jgi:RNA polymerase sigma factor (TIGR02999 family)